MEKIKLKTYNPLTAGKIKEAITEINDNHYHFINLFPLGGEDKFIILYTEKEEMKETTTTPPKEDIARFSSIPEMPVSQPAYSEKSFDIKQFLIDNKIMVIIAIAIIALIYFVGIK